VGLLVYSVITQQITTMVPRRGVVYRLLYRRVNGDSTGEVEQFNIADGLQQTEGNPLYFFLYGCEPLRIYGGAEYG